MIGKLKRLREKYRRPRKTNLSLTLHSVLVWVIGAISMFVAILGMSLYLSGWDWSEIDIREKVVDEDESNEYREGWICKDEGMDRYDVFNVGAGFTDAELSTKFANGEVIVDIEEVPELLPVDDLGGNKIIWFEEVNPEIRNPRCTLANGEPAKGDIRLMAAKILDANELKTVYVGIDAPGNSNMISLVDVWGDSYLVYQLENKYMYVMDLTEFTIVNRLHVYNSEGTLYDNSAYHDQNLYFISDDQILKYVKDMSADSNEGYFHTLYLYRNGVWEVVGTYPFIIPDGYESDFLDNYPYEGPYPTGQEFSLSFLRNYFSLSRISEENSEERSVDIYDMSLLLTSEEVTAEPIVSVSGIGSYVWGYDNILYYTLHSNQRELYAYDVTERTSSLIAELDEPVILWDYLPGIKEISYVLANDFLNNDVVMPGGGLINIEKGDVEDEYRCGNELLIGGWIAYISDGVYVSSRYNEIKQDSDERVLFLYDEKKAEEYPLSQKVVGGFYIIPSL